MRAPLGPFLHQLTWLKQTCYIFVFTALLLDVHFLNLHNNNEMYDVWGNLACTTYKYYQIQKERGD